MYQTEVLVIGCGISGAIAALELADKGVSVVVIASGNSGKESNSFFAQGGITYVGEEDTPNSLAADIEKAGSGLCHPEAVEQLVKHGPKLVSELLLKKFPIQFDHKENGELLLTKEAAHSRPRVLYHRDHTGSAIMQVLLERIMAHPNITFKPAHSAVDLITLSHHSKTKTDIYQPSTCVGAYVLDHKSEKVEVFFAKYTVLATGGLGEVFLHTTNPKEARGDGVAMAYRAGARIMNMEYVQFHPTAFYLPGHRRFLISEALRGEGADLLSWDLKPFMHKYHPDGALAPRDVVSRAIYEEMMQTNAPHLWLDIHHKDPNWIRSRFPSIYEYCIQKGVDITRQPIPIVPAAHYSCGGIAIDKYGKTSIGRLFSVGEVACSGLHGANRLASTSLLEGVVWGKFCADFLFENIKDKKNIYFPPVDEWSMGKEKEDSVLIQQDWLTIQETMWNYVGLYRDTKRLSRALLMLRQLHDQILSFYENTQLSPSLLGLRNGIQTSLLITQGAIRNKTSLGCHYRVN